jgi:hypothetical protein
VAVRRADRGLAQLANQAEQLGEPRRAEVTVDQRNVSREAAQVRARRERALVRGGEDDAACLLVVTSGLQRSDQVGEQLGRERVPSVGLVQADRRDVLVDVVQQRVEVGQGALLGRMSGK